MSDETPASQRRVDAQRRIELEAQAARAEAEQAQARIDAFVAEAARRGITPEPLRATLMDGTSVRTDKQGWYLRRNHSLAIGTDGSYYVLTVAGGAMARFTGVKLAPSQPVMVIGRGGRDGETGDLQWFLDQRLADGNAGR